MSFSKLVAAFVIGLLLVLAAPAQQPCVKSQHGRLVGRLRDLCEVGIAKAVVAIKGEKVKRKVKSNREGSFKICLPTGTYQITVEKYGFKRYIVNDVQVTMDSAATVNLDMEAGYASDDPNAGKESLKPCPPPNNGMHPTANSAALIVSLDGLEVVCAAGDAWR